MKNTLIVVDKIKRHTGATHYFQGEAHIGSSINNVDVMELEKFMNPYSLRGRRYHLVILPEILQQSEEAREKAYLLTAGLEGQVIYQ